MSKAYVDGFVLPVPKGRLDEYRAMAEMASKVSLECGALDYRECIVEDLTTHGTRSFAEMTGADDTETVILAWITWESRAARDAGNEKLMQDPRLTDMMDPERPVFDMARMAWAGFETLVHRSASGGD